MEKLLLVLCAIVCLKGYGQIAFEKGYYIDNTGQKIEGLIKNIGWGMNPSQFEYKTSETSEAIAMNIESVKEFGINNTVKFVRETVKIDQSSEQISDVSFERNPIFKEETVFLDVLVEGSASLYYYTDKNVKRFFYSKNNSEILPLVYKTYKIANNTIEKNIQYKQELWTNLKYEEIEIDRVNQIEYSKKSLTSFFVEYNTSTNSEFLNFEKNKNRDLFNLSLRAHINNASLNIENSSYRFLNTDFGNKTNLGFGIEAEFILPLRQNKWAIVIEPTYQSYNIERETVNSNSGNNSQTKIAVEYKSIEIPIGIRHYFFLNNNSKIYVNAFYIFDATLGESIKLQRTNIGSNYNDFLNIKSLSNLGVGVGYKLKNRYSIEMRYQTSRNILGNYIFWNSDYKKVSVIIGYSLF